MWKTIFLFLFVFFAVWENNNFVCWVHFTVFVCDLLTWCPVFESVHGSVSGEVDCW